MKKFIFIIFIILGCFFVAASAQAKSEIDVLLDELDKTIAERFTYAEKRQTKICQLKTELANTAALDGQYRIMSDIINEYLPFICDSAENYIVKKLEIARKMNRKEYLQESMLQLAFVYSLSGLFTQAVEILNTVKYEDLSPYLRTTYCWNLIRYYENLIKYTDDNKFTLEYIEKKSACRDTLIAILSPTSGLGRKEVVFKLQENGEYIEAYNIMHDIYSRQEPSTHGYAMESMMMAQLYHLMDSAYQEKKHLILASITDLKMAIKENEALLSLAIMLYKNGDIDRAYNYVKVALEDANFYNSRFRNTVIARVHPLIENTYLYKIEQQKNNLRLFTILLVFFIVALVITISLIYRQNRIVSKARKNLRKMNEQLVGLNKKLDEANLVKEKYIGYFMNQCAVYIDKMDSYRKLINRKVKAKQIDELYSLTSSTLTIDDAVEQLYNTFDEVFLKLYPNFVEAVNHLLKDGEKYHTKKGLNTELRIMALMRLGVTDTNQIAAFLRYSVQTVYNYKSKMRGKAKTDQDTFEEKLKKIGGISLQ
jgi:tetratricopeptide (TPR) repeat protein